MIADIISSLSLRMGVGYVFIRFGVEKIVDWRGWAVLMPPVVTEHFAPALGIAPAALLHVLGYLEVLIGLHLVLGFLTRGAAVAAALVLAGAVLIMGSTGIGVRDTGLLCGAIAIAASGGGRCSIDGRRERVRALRPLEGCVS